MLSEYAEEEAVKHQESACLRMQRQNSSTVRSCQCGRTEVLSILEKCINTQTGTDGFPIILKHTCVTDRQGQPLFRFEKTPLHCISCLCKNGSFTSAISNRASHCITMPLRILTAQALLWAKQHCWMGSLVRQIDAEATQSY